MRVPSIRGREPVRELIAQHVNNWRRAVIAIGTTGLLGTLLVTSVIQATTSTAFSFNWNGLPTSPQRWTGVGQGWDTQIHVRGTGDLMSDPMAAEHGADCGAPPAMHTIQTLADGVFLCRNHLMTAIGDQGYGEIALTPDHMVDFSNGTATITVQVSTEQRNASDFIDLWISPYNDNITLPIEFGVDGQAAHPVHGIRFSFNHSGVLGDRSGDVRVFNNQPGEFAGTPLPKAACLFDSDPKCIGDQSVGVVPPSPTTRTTYEIDISAGHVKFGVPGVVTWTDTNFNFPFTQGIVQLVHHSYNPLKHDPGSGIDTWHWSNFSISQSIPFTIIGGNERSIHAGGPTTVHFASPAPANSYFRFSGIGPQKSTYQVSYNNGATWVSPALQVGQGTHDEQFSSYWTPVPAGTTTVMFRGNNWWGGPWWVRDPSIWSLSAPGGTTTAPPPNPTAPPSTVPKPPMSINGMPCTVTINGTQQSGTCTGTFQPK